ncbi:MAG: DUF4011 domain-containing protein [Bacteroidetes bacterium]|nr:DUF4011 domain-containing protein [Bacteroidota bacterium]
MSTELAAFLHACKLRLLNLNQANRALRLPRLLPGREVDVHDLSWYNGLRPEQLVQQVMARHYVPLLSPQAAANPQHTHIHHRLTQLHRYLTLCEQETGAYDLYLGYPFVEGRFQDGTLVRCPLLQFPVRLVRGARTGWALHPRETTDGLLNEAFFRALEKHQEHPLPSGFWQDGLDSRRGELRELLNALYAHLKTYSLPIDFNSELFLQVVDRFVEYGNEYMELWPAGSLKLMPQAVLGVFPPYDTALLQDYQALEQQPDTFPLYALLEPRPQEVDVSPVGHPFALPADFTQLMALRKVQAGHSLVVHGPPGTGKSQLIVNLVVDYLAQGKRVLVASEKRAALDVVARRLQALGLGPWYALIHDFRTDRDRLYARLAETLVRLPALQKQVAAEQPRYAELARQQNQYAELARQVEARYKVLCKPLPCGWSPDELYARVASKPLQPPWPQLPAAAFTRYTLADFCLRAQRCQPYADLLQPDHPWYARRSLDALPETDREAQQQWVAALPREMVQAREHWLACHLKGQALANDPDLPQQVAQLHQLNARIQAHPQHHPALARWLSAPLPVPLLQQQLDQLMTVYQSLGALSLLGFEALPGREALFAAITRYEEQGIWQGAWYRSWRQARKQLRNHLAGQGQTLRMRQVRQLAVQLQQADTLLRQLDALCQHPFWADLADISQGAAWFWQLRQRADALQWLASQYVPVAVLPALRPVSTAAYTLDAAKWTKRLQQADILLQHWQAWQAFTHTCQTLLSPSLAGVLGEEARSGEDYPQAQLLRRCYMPERMLALDQLLSAMPPHYETLVRQVAARGEWENPGWATSLESHMLQAWLRDAEAGEPLLSDELREDYAVRLAQLVKLETHLSAQAAAHACHVVEQRAARCVQADDTLPAHLRELHHQLTKKRRIWPLRQVASRYWSQDLDRLMPCVLASPETVAAVFPMTAELFDLVVIDEASQCPTERVFTTLLRGTQWVVAGDPHQLPPMDLFQVQVNTEQLLAARQDTFHSLGSAIDSESILDLARQRLPQAHLLGHYRSHHPALIEFSNRAFYEGKLQSLPPREQELLFWPPIRYHQLGGSRAQHINEVEAHAIVAEIERLLRHPARPTLGVVTFNFQQMQYIQDVLDQRILELLRTDESAASALAAEFERQVAGEFAGLFIKNIENVQGDERDIILFSVGYAPNAQGRVPATFGWLNQAGGQNRLNVAVTRARHQVQVFASFLPEQLDTEQSRHPGPRLLKNYLRYAKAVSDGHLQEQARVLEGLSPALQVLPAALPVVTDFCNDLRAAGLPAHLAPHYANGLFELWLQSADARVQLAIQLEPAGHPAGRVSLLDNPRRLQAARIPFLHFSARQLWASRAGCVQQVLHTWQKLCENTAIVL